MIANRRSEQSVPRSARCGAGLALILGVLLCVTVTARAEQAPATEPAPGVQSQQATPAESAPPAPAQAPRGDGFFGTIGRWIDRSIARVGTAWREQSESVPGEARKSIEISLLPKAKIVSGRERCETAANGAPDCRGAIEALCRSKGLAAGKSLDVQSVEKCPARVWISGTQSATRECRMESYVQRAFCQ